MIIKVIASNTQKVIIKYSKDVTVKRVHTDEETGAKSLVDVVINQAIDKSISFTKMKAVDLALLKQFVTSFPFSQITIPQIAEELEITIQIKNVELSEETGSLPSPIPDDTKIFIAKVGEVLNDLITNY